MGLPPTKALHKTLAVSESVSSFTFSHIEIGGIEHFLGHDDFQRQESKP